MGQPEIMYVVNFHLVDDEFSHCTVTPITVTRRGVLPGCTGVSISAIDSAGRKFQGSPDNYFASESDAWRHVKESVEEIIASLEEDAQTALDGAERARAFLAEVTTKSTSRRAR